MDSVVNILLDSFPGLSVPSTLCLPLPATATLAELFSAIRDVLPANLPTQTRLILTSTSNTPIYDSPAITIAELLSECRPTAQNCQHHVLAGPGSSCGSSPSSSSFLPLRLSAPLVGGKGGFGSQLRAAGGRMSSRKKKQNAELATGSARNLDGRRLRTITEAKNLATYLATRPEMERKEKEERRKRWEQVIELAEQREADMRAGKGVDGRRRGISDEWVDEKEEVGENVRNAVRLAMLADEEKGKGKGRDVAPQEGESSGSGGSLPPSDEDSEGEGEEDLMELDEDGMSRLIKEAEAGDADAIWVLQNRLKIPSALLPTPKSQPKPQRRFAGFDEDDDELSSSGDEEVSAQPADKGKHSVDST
ncbi:hypothetical protein LTR84_005055 [Exophiala bonariae]|uniref:Sde2 N-terminal ubiquitin domain-containing protein n=1 Tax=Exophiala bonariae TaxID=1690606 RepID=A0AAV9NP25_9EURO|nr:hypothetical protein LTR84_005055 [Exophiala bonariae]